MKFSDYLIESKEVSIKSLTYHLISSLLLVLVWFLFVVYQFLSGVEPVLFVVAVGLLVCDVLLCVGDYLVLSDLLGKED